MCIGLWTCILSSKLQALAKNPTTVETLTYSFQDRKNEKLQQKKVVANALIVFSLILTLENNTNPKIVSLKKFPDMNFTLHSRHSS